jgi:integration host factor subunit beta
MTRSKLVDRLHSRFHQLTQRDISESVSVILNAIGDSLAKGDRTEIRGFGGFQVYVRPPKIGRNPKTGEIISVPEKAAPHFRPGKELKAIVKNCVERN